MKSLIPYLSDAELAEEVEGLEGLKARSGPGTGWYFGPEHQEYLDACKEAQAERAGAAA